MKRFALILLGCALIMGMSQCKKDNTNTPNNEGVRITLTANGSQDSKTDFNAGDFVWTNGATEYIYVGGSTHGYLGYLTGTGNGTYVTEFRGTLPGPIDNNETLYFFYLGKGVNSTAKVESVSFANQDGTKDNVTKNHIAIGHDVYVTGKTAYTANLEMAMSIAWFDTQAFIGSEITLNGTGGIYTAAAINYTQGKIEGSSAAGGIKIGGPSANCYVALLPQQTPGGPTLVFTDNTTPPYVGRIAFNDQIYAGKFYCSLTGGSGARALVINASQESGK